MLDVALEPLAIVKDPMKCYLGRGGTTKLPMY